MSSSAATIEIARRFCGPPTSGNGGYVGGRLAACLPPPTGEPGVAVRLFAPPPLEAPLVVRVEDEGASLFDGETKVASARRIPIDLRPPDAPSFEGAADAARRFRGFEHTPFPRCFVCGPERAADDGLRIFPGDLAEDTTRFAAPWRPDASLVPKGREGDRVPPEFVWAALDCPGAFAFPQPEGRVVLLGELQVELRGDVHVGERCVLASWDIDRSGRKHTTGSALYGEDGLCRGLARGIWIEIDPEVVPRN